MRRVFPVLAVLLMPVAALAEPLAPPPSYADRALPDPQQEAAARQLMAVIRCVQCQGQAVGDSDAPIAAAMRDTIRRHIARGERPADVRRWLITRYGSYISYDPPFGVATLLLWLAPLLLVVAGGLTVRQLFVRAEP